MRLSSNISQVIRRLERLQAGLPEAVKAALDPAYWGPRLEVVTLKTLQAMFAQERDVQARARLDRMAQQIAETLIAVARPEGILIRCWLPPDSVKSFTLTSAAEFNLKQRTPMGRMRKWAMPDAAGEANLASARQTVLDWVALEKNRDERDAGLTDEEIADRLMEILGLSDRAIPRERTPEMDMAAVALTDAIQSWLSGEGQSPPTTKMQDAAPVNPGTLDPAMARQWLGAVMEAWKAFVRAHLKERLDMELSKLNKRIQTEMI